MLPERGSITTMRAACLMVGALMLLVPAAGARAATLPVEHRLEVELIPSAHLLVGRDHLTVSTDGRRKLVVGLSDRVTHLHVDVDGQPRTFRFTNNELEIPLEPDERRRALEIVISYEAVFNDPFPHTPVNTDNPGFGVTGTITAEGVFLLAGAGWYPDVVDGIDTFPLVRVKAPAGMLAVTAGESLGHVERDGATISEWRVGRPVRGLALSAAAYQMRERREGDLVAVTYFTSANQDLAPAYLEAVIRYLTLYTERFGPYPFPKFAVVENFFPTGYGFPSYTLLGSTVLRLPFILATSLGHEIAHCWWGNGVQVDYEWGNWSEALTTYVADYLYAEMASAAEARDYRLQAIRNYTTLVPPARDMPLARFTSRTDPLTRAIGYDKGMMVFHMLRQSVGEEAFWGALRDVYRERLFVPTSWDDLRLAFERRSGRPLGPFFDQWVGRKGAPRLHLGDVQTAREGGELKVTGRLIQEKPFFTAGLDMALDGAGHHARQRLTIVDETTRFDLAAPAGAAQLSADPDHHLLRRLDPAEIPPTVNRLKSSPSVLLVVCASAPANGQEVAETLAEALGLQAYSIAAERNVDRALLDGRDVILVGTPRDPEWLRAHPPALKLNPQGFALDPGGEAGGADAFFGVFAHPHQPGRVLALLLPLSPDHAERVAAKITHYGRYSYLVFRGDRNLARGWWPVEASPVSIPIP
jgi:Peptidase family M1 domain